MDGSYRRLKQNLIHLKAKWGTDELTVDLNTEEKYELSGKFLNFYNLYSTYLLETFHISCLQVFLTGMRDRLLEPALVLFSNRKELTSAIIHMINRYDAEANSSQTKRRIYELEMVVARLATRIYKNYNVVVKTHVFGSRVTGLAAENSDVDIYLQIGEKFLDD